MGKRNYPVVVVLLLVSPIIHGAACVEDVAPSLSEPGGQPDVTEDAASSLPLLTDKDVHLYAQEAYEGFSLDIEQAVAERHAELVTAGMDCARHLFDWSDIEPVEGDYQLNEMIESLDARLASGIRYQFCNITVIDSSGAVALPPYINDLLASGVRWDDPRIVGAFTNLLDVVVPAMLERGTYMIGFGNELGSYYEDHPQQAASVAGFVQAAIAHTRTINSQLACTITFAGPTDPAITPLMSLIDVATFNSYFYELAHDNCEIDGFPLQLAHATGPSGVGGLLDDLINVSEDKLICIQEIGQSTGWNDDPQTLGSLASLDNQRAMIASLAHELHVRRDRFRTVSLWTLNDHTLDGIRYLGDELLSEQFPRCYTDNVNEIFGPTGLVRSDATASTKPAFDEFKVAIGCLKTGSHNTCIEDYAKIATLNLDD